MNEEIKLKQIELENAKIKAATTEDKEDRRKVHSLSKELKTEYKNAEEKWMKNQARNHENDPSLSWRQLKNSRWFYFKLSKKECRHNE